MGKPVKIIDLARKMIKLADLSLMGHHDKDCGTATGRKLMKNCLMTLQNNPDLPR
jgi:FlaA1/EpsC-like NDP-sugar epimerase